MSLKIHRTAMRRKGASRPLRKLYDYGYIRKKDRILDFGCGRGADVRWLKRKGHKVVGYDPHEPFGFAKKPKGKFGVVLMTYVVNCLPTRRERCEAVAEAWRYVRPGGYIFVTARTPKDIDAAARKGKWDRYTDGFLTGRSTFQKGLVVEQLVSYFIGRPHVGYYEYIIAPYTNVIVPKSIRKKP